MVEITGLPPVPTAGPTAKTATPRPAQPAEDKAKPTDRTIHDTVSLSSGGDSVLNVARGLDLAKEIRQNGGGIQAKDLNLAVDDVFRITRQFSEVLKAGFKSTFFFFRR